MKILSVILFTSLVLFSCCISKKSLQETKDSARENVLINQYKNDTTGFYPLKSQQLIDSLHPKKGYTYWELSRDERIIESYHRKRKNSDKSLTPLPTGKGFLIVRPPTTSSCHLSAIYNGSPHSISTKSELLRFLGKIDTPFEAALWLFLIKGKWTNCKYKQVDDGFLLRFDDYPPTDMVFEHIIREAYDTRTLFIGHDGFICEVKTEYHRRVYRKKEYVGKVKIHVSKISIPGDSIEISEGDDKFDFYLSSSGFIFPEGADHYLRYFERGVVYPPEAIEHGIEGYIIVQYTMEKSGKLNDIMIMRGLDRLFDKEVIRMLKNRSENLIENVRSGWRAREATVTLRVEATLMEV